MMVMEQQLVTVIPILYKASIKSANLFIKVADLKQNVDLIFTYLSFIIKTVQLQQLDFNTKNQQ